MRTSLIELQQIEEYIFNGKGSEAALNDTSLLTDSDKAEKVMWQKETYNIVQQYGRRKLKLELETIHRKLFTESRYSKFRRQIMRLFR